MTDQTTQTPAPRPRYLRVNLLGERSFLLEVLQDDDQALAGYEVNRQGERLRERRLDRRYRFSTFEIQL